MNEIIFQDDLLFVVSNPDNTILIHNTFLELNEEVQELRKILKK